MTQCTFEVAIIGGGLTGLTAAVFLARAGKSVVLFEKEEQLGGLAQTTEMNGALFNLGPHAMYEGGAALRILKEIGCVPEGGYALKGRMIGILSGSLLDVSVDLTNEESQEWKKVMTHLNKIDTKLILHVSLQEWIDTNIRFQRVRLLFQAMCRQWSYCSNMKGLSAGFVIKQGQLASQGVFYIENGWQTVVNSLKH